LTTAIYDNDPTSVASLRRHVEDLRLGEATTAFIDTFENQRLAMTPASIRKRTKAERQPNGTNSL
jgi:hypothetical protein